MKSQQTEELHNKLHFIHCASSGPTDMGFLEADIYMKASMISDLEGFYFSFITAAQVSIVVSSSNTVHAFVNINVYLTCMSSALILTVLPLIN